MHCYWCGSFCRDNGNLIRFRAVCTVVMLIWTDSMQRGLHGFNAAV